jgi:hypothetical protein
MPYFCDIRQWIVLVHSSVFPDSRMRSSICHARPTKEVLACLREILQMQNSNIDIKYPYTYLLSTLETHKEQPTNWKETKQDDR